MIVWTELDKGQNHLSKKIEKKLLPLLIQGLLRPKLVQFGNDHVLPYIIIRFRQIIQANNIIGVQSGLIMHCPLDWIFLSETINDLT